MDVSAAQATFFAASVAGLAALITAAAEDCRKSGVRWLSWIGRKPFTCALCVGFWVGIVAAHELKMMHPVMWAGVGAAAAWVLNRAVTGES